MTEDYGYDLVKTTILAGAGIFILYYIYRFFSLRGTPIILGNKTLETATKQIYVDIPEIWYPYQPGDNKDSVAIKVIPTVGIEGTNWVLNFKPVTTTILGLKTQYTPEPIKIPVSSTLTITDLAARLIPVVTQTPAPLGWNIKFTPITILM